MNFKEKAEHFLQLCAAGDLSKAFNGHVDEEHFIHHNPYFRSDTQSLKQGMQESANTHPTKILKYNAAFMKII